MGIADNMLGQFRAYCLNLTGKLSSYSRFKNPNLSCSKNIN